jgi:hypothetical protein
MSENKGQTNRAFIEEVGSGMAICFCVTLLQR